MECVQLSQKQSDSWNLKVIHIGISLTKCGIQMSSIWAFFSVCDWGFQYFVFSVMQQNQLNVVNPNHELSSQVHTCNKSISTTGDWSDIVEKLRQVWFVFTGFWFSPEKFNSVRIKVGERRWTKFVMMKVMTIMTILFNDVWTTFFLHKRD